MTTFKFKHHLRRHRTLILTGSLLILGIGFTTQQTISAPNAADSVKSLTTLSPYTSEGDIFYTQLIQNPQFDRILTELQTLSHSPQTTAITLTNLGTCLSLLAWDENNEAKLLLLAQQADEAFDNALKKSPNHWDAWMAKADLYAHSSDDQLEQYAATILAELSSDSDSNLASAEKKKKARLLLNKLASKTIK